MRTAERDALRANSTSTPNFTALTILAIAVIVYGSLYPFEFFYAADSPLKALLSTWLDLTGRGDLISNILLYFPVGFFGVQSGYKPSPDYRRIALTVMGGLTLSTALELAQFFDMGRYSAMSDVYANGAGSLLGALTGTGFMIRVRSPSLEAIRERPFIVLVLACWVSFRLYPYAPTTDLPELDIYYQAIVWIAIGVFLEALFGAARSRLALVLFFAAVMCGRRLAAGIAFSQAEVAGGILAVSIWMPLSYLSSRARTLIVTACFTGAVVLRGLKPTFDTTPRPFEWIPFLSLMEGSIHADVLSFFFKTFTYGTLIWLFVRASSRWGMAIGAGALLILCLSACAVYLPGPPPEITDLIIFLLVSGTMRLMGERAA